MKKAFFQLHLAIFLAGFTAIIGKLILLNEGLLVWYRILFTVIILGVLMMLKKQMQRLTLKEIVKISCVGFIITAHWVFFYGAIKYANVSVALVCLSSTGFFTSILEPIILRKRIVFVELALSMITICGIYIIFDFHPQYKLGIFLGLLSAVGSAVFPIFNKQLLERYTPRTLTLYELSGGLLILTLLLPLYFQIFKPTYYLPTRIDFIWLIVLAAGCTVFSFDLLFSALKRLSAFTVNLSYNLEPLYGIILAFIVFKENEHLNPWFYLGLSLILLAVCLQMLREWRQRKVRLKTVVTA